MADSWIDHIPSHEREKIRKRLRSPEEYERLREKVKGPEDLERELKKAEHLAELHFRLETEPQAQQSLRETIEKDLREQGMEVVLERSDLSIDAKRALEQGKFTVRVAPHPGTHEDQIVVVPEGNVQERVPIKPSLSDRYLGQFLKGM